MVKRIPQRNDPSGLEPKEWYIGDSGLIEVLPYFAYEISLHKYWKNGYCLLGSKLYKSDRPLDIKKGLAINKQKDYTLEKEITLVGAPKGFLEENKFKLYTPNYKKLKKK